MPKPLKFNKDIAELESHAVKWWPNDLKKQSASISPIPLLTSTQEDFIAILRLCTKTPTQVFDLIEAAKFPANLFLKHLTVLADYGGETTKRLNKNFKSIFSVPAGSPLYMECAFNGKKFKYEFEALPISGELSNARLEIDGDRIAKAAPLKPVIKDMIMLLLFGSNAINAVGADLEKCEISGILGKDEELDTYVKQKYIWVSRITGGATSNTQGQLAQTIVCDYLKHHLGSSYKITRNGAIKLKDYSKKSGMPFDIVVEKGNSYIGIEVSFQVTTNSVIERKGGQAQERQHLMHQAGYKIAYVLDGAGNFQRRSAVSTICQFSDCTVAYSEAEFAVLVEFIKKYL